MNRRLLLFGILLLLFGVISAYESGQQFIYGIANPNNTVSSATSLNASTAAYLPIKVNQTSLLEFGYNSSSPINLYILNSSAFIAALQDMDPNALGHEVALYEGKGTLYVENKSASGIFPYEQSYVGYVPAPAYSTNSLYVTPGIYYIVLSNPGNSIASVSYSYINRPLSSLNLSNGSIFGYGLIGGILLVLGFVLVIYSLFLKGKPKEDSETVNEANVDNIYSSIEAKKKAKKSLRRRGSSIINGKARRAASRR
ncbi:MAG: hypothetical protein QXF01_01600 [Candidatus Micrarchaeaceae archaeon]